MHTKKLLLLFLLLFSFNTQAFLPRIFYQSVDKQDIYTEESTATLQLDKLNIGSAATDIDTIVTGTGDNNIFPTQGYVDDSLTTAISGADNFVPLFNGANALDSSAIDQTELELLNGMASVSTGTSDNDKLVTQGYVDDNFLDGNFVLSNTADPTKALDFDLSGLTTATTRTMTVPDASGTLLLGTGTSSYVPYFNGTNSVTSSANLSFDGSTLDVLQLNIGGATADVTSISTGTADNDKLATKGYVDDNAGAGGGGAVDFLSSKEIGDYGTYDDGAVSEPVDGTGGTATVVTKSEETGSPISTEGLNVKISKSAADGQGEGVSVNFATRGEVDYASSNVVSVSVKSSANYADDDFGVYLYDVTNSALIHPRVSDIKANSFPAEQTFYFATPPDSSSLRLIFHCQTTNASAYDLTAIIKVSPAENFINGVAWKTYDRSAVGNITGTNWTTGTAELMPFQTIDGQWKLQFNVVGSFSDNITDRRIDFVGVDFKNDNEAYTLSQNTGANAYVKNHVVNAGSTTLYATFSAAVTGQVSYSGVVALTGKPTWATDSTVHYGGSSKVIVDYSGNGGEAITASVTNIPFATEVNDSNGAWDGDEFTAPYSDFYSITGSVLYTTNINEKLKLYVQPVGGSYAFIKAIGQYTTTATDQHVFNGGIYLNAGEKFAIRSSTGATLSNSASNHHIAITNGGAGQSVVPTEKIIAKYRSNNGATINTNSETRFNAEDKVKDTHNAVTIGVGSWVFTSPRTTCYKVSAGVKYQSGAWNANEPYWMLLYNNGTGDEYIDYDSNETSITTHRRSGGTGFVCLAAGETTYVTIYHNSGANKDLETTSAYNFINIVEQ